MAGRNKLIDTIVKYINSEHWMSKTGEGIGEALYLEVDPTSALRDWLWSNWDPYFIEGAEAGGDTSIPFDSNLSGIMSEIAYGTPDNILEALTDNEITPEVQNAAWNHMWEDRVHSEVWKM